MERFAHYGISARLSRGLEISVRYDRSGLIAERPKVTAAGDCNDARTREGGTDLLDNLDAVAARHDDVNDDDVRWAPEKIFNSCQTVVGGQDLKADASQNLAN